MASSINELPAKEQSEVVNLSGLQTEHRNSKSANIDRMSTLDLCRLFNQQDSEITTAVQKCIPNIAQAIDALTERVRKGGRVFYIGAGTSGRLGVLDASEIPPTFSTPAENFVAMIAGGDSALRVAKEGAEDDRDGAERDLAQHNLNPDVDSLIGIASSGRTPYVLGGLAHAKSLGCLTLAVVCVHPSVIGTEGNVDYLIAPVTGPEIVTGSTRMKAGTATKLVLNMLSTGIMIKLGKTYGNLMVDLKATNIKLKQRARNILRSIGGEKCSQPDDELDSILESCHGSVKLAAVVIVLGISPSDAAIKLEESSGHLALVLKPVELPGKQVPLREKIVLCVDAGGSSCKAVVLTLSGLVGKGTAGPCNVTQASISNAVSSIAKATQEAVDNCALTTGQPFQSINFSSVRIGIAGYSRPYLIPLINNALSELFGRPINEGLTITPDVALLPFIFAHQPQTESVIVLIAGTGSIAMSYQRTPNGTFVQSDRAGGWGHMLGDDGSGYAIGRQAIRLALRYVDCRRISETTGRSVENASLLVDAVLRHFGVTVGSEDNGVASSISPAAQEESGENLASSTKITELNSMDLLSAILRGPGNRADGNDSTIPTCGPKDIAALAQTVLHLAAEGDQEAIQIAQRAIEDLMDSVKSLLNPKAIDKTGLVLSGGLMKNVWMRDAAVTAATKVTGIEAISVVDEPSLIGARYDLLD